MGRGVGKTHVRDFSHHQNAKFLLFLKYKSFFLRESPLGRANRETKAVFCCVIVQTGWGGGGGKKVRSLCCSKEFPVLRKNGGRCRAAA